MITRRRFLQGMGAGVLVALYSAFHGAFVEPMLLQRVKRDQISLPNWPRGFKLRIVALADVHACEPWMSNDRIGKIVDQANRLEPDIIFLLGDYLTSLEDVKRYTAPREWAPIFGQLSARVGVFAILGNHDWWDDEEAQRRGEGPTAVREAFEANGIPVLENDAVRVEKDGVGFWVAGLGDQLAFPPNTLYGRDHWRGLDDLPGTLAKVETEEPVILLAHEPDIFSRVPERVSLTLSGHTHGGQVRLLGWSPVVPSAFGNRYAYGHVMEGGRHLLVSGGLGMSVMPLRFGMRPEINLIEVG